MPGTIAIQEDAETVDMRELFRARAGDDGRALLFEDEVYSWREHVQASLDRAALLLALRPPQTSIRSPVQTVVCW